MPRLLRVQFLLAAMILTVSGSAGPALAGSFATAYDMSVFLNESHPFDTAPQTPLPQSSAPIMQGAASTAIAADPLAAEDDFGDDEFGDLDGLDDLVAQGEEIDVNDPIEPVNRFVFGFNQIIENVILRPLSYGYNAVVPEFGRVAVRNFLDNLSSPVVLANDLLQGEPARAWDTTQRMVINTTIGVGGLWDAAAAFGIEEHREDFGQTLGVWGVGEGPYLVLPLLGPSNPRDLVGRFGVDPFLDPVGLYLGNTDQDEWQYARTGAEAFTAYAAIVDDLDMLEETSLDYYAAVRNFYRQRRNAEIANQD